MFSPRVTNAGRSITSLTQHQLDNVDHSGRSSTSDDAKSQQLIPVASPHSPNAFVGSRQPKSSSGKAAAQIARGIDGKSDSLNTDHDGNDSDRSISRATGTSVSTRINVTGLPTGISASNPDQRRVVVALERLVRYSNHIAIRSNRLTLPNGSFRIAGPRPSDKTSRNRLRSFVNDCNDAIEQIAPHAQGENELAKRARVKLWGLQQRFAEIHSLLTSPPANLSDHALNRRLASLSRGAAQDATRLAQMGAAWLNAKSPSVMTAGGQPVVSPNVWARIGRSSARRQPGRGARVSTPGSYGRQKTDFRDDPFGGTRARLTKPPRKPRAKIPNSKYTHVGNQHDLRQEHMQQQMLMQQYQQSLNGVADAVKQASQFVIQTNNDISRAVDKATRM